MVIICQRPFDIEKDQLLCPENSFLHRDEEGQYRCISNRCRPEPQDKKTPIVGIIVATLTGVFLVAFLLYFFLL